MENLIKEEIEIDFSSSFSHSVNKLIDEELDSSQLDINKKIILFGSGFQGQIALEYLRKRGFSIYAFCDNNPQKHGTNIDGVICISPSELLDVGDAFVLVTSKHASVDICMQLLSLGIPHVLFDHFVFCNNVEEIKRVFDYLEDDFSKKTLSTLLEASFLKNNEEIKNVWVKNQYFCLPDFSIFKANEVFVDCGAYVGDTLEQFIFTHNVLFKKYYAFEPGKRQFEALKIRAKRLTAEWALDNNTIECVLAGVGEKNEVGSVMSNPSDLFSAHLSGNYCDGEDKVSIYALDSYLENSEVTFIKADIEGDEMQMLRGAQNIIKNQKPRLAICIYHKPQDYYEIPNFIKSLVPEYKMAIRHHAVNLAETVLYCWT